MVWEAKYKGCPWLETPEMKRWREEELPKAERAKCLILVGPYKAWARPSGLGTSSLTTTCILGG